MPEDPDEIFKFQVELVEVEEAPSDDEGDHKRSKIDQSPAPLPSEWEEGREALSGRVTLPGSPDRVPLAGRSRIEALPSSASTQTQPAETAASGEVTPTSSLVQTRYGDEQPSERTSSFRKIFRKREPEQGVDAGESALSVTPQTVDQPSFLKRVWAKLNSDIGKGKSPSPTETDSESHPEEVPVDSSLTPGFQLTEDEGSAPAPAQEPPVVSEPSPAPPEPPVVFEPSPMEEPEPPVVSEPALVEEPEPPVVSEPAPIDDVDAEKKPSLFSRIWAKLNSDIGKKSVPESASDASVLVPVEKPEPPAVLEPVPVEEPEPPVVFESVLVEEPEPPVVSEPSPVEEPEPPAVFEPAAAEAAPPAVLEPVPVEDVDAEKKPSLFSRIWAKLNSDIGKKSVPESAPAVPDPASAEAAPPAVFEPSPVEEPEPLAVSEPAPVEEPEPPAVFEPAPAEEEPPVVFEPAPAEDTPTAEKASLWSRLRRSKDDDSKTIAGDLTEPGSDKDERPKLIVSEESEVISLGGVRDESDLSDRERRRAERKRKREEEKLRAEEKREKKLAVKNKLRSLNESTDRWAERKKKERQAKKKVKAKEAKIKEEERKAKEEEKAKLAAQKKEEKGPGFRERLAEQRRRKSAEKARRIGKDIVGLKLGASSVRAVHLQEDKPIKVYEYPLPEGVIEDGILEEPEELTKALKEMWSQSGMSSKKVNFSLNNRLITVRTIPHLQIDDEQLDQALAYMASIVIAPMDPEESIIDYAKLSRTGDGQDIQMAAADRSMVESYVKAIEKAGLSAVSCEIGALAASRAMIVPRVPGQAHFVVDVGSELTAVTAVSGPDLFFYHVIEIGGNDFTDAIASATGRGFLEAERYKLGSSMSDPDPRVSAALTRVADQLAQELQQSKNYFQDDTKRGGRPVISWSLIGGGAKLEGLQEHLQLYTHIGDMVEIEPWPGLTGAPDLEMNTDVLGLAKSHTMSLIPDASAGSFSVTAPFRRKAKISLSEADKRAKRLSKSRAQKKDVNYKLYGILAAMAILVGSYFMANKLTPTDTPASVNPAGAPVGSTVLSYDNPDATRVAKLLSSSLDLETFSQLAKLTESSDVYIQSATIDKDKLQLAGVGANLELVRSFSKKVSDALPSADVQLKPGTLNTNGQGFNMIITAPNTPEGN